MYADVLFAVLKPVTYVDRDEVIEVAGVAIFVGRNLVVTVRHGKSSVLRTVRQQLEREEVEPADVGPVCVLYQAADHVVAEYEVAIAAIAAINDDVAEIEAQVFSTDGGDHAERIYKLKREVLEFRRAVAPLAGPLERLASGRAR